MTGSIHQRATGSRVRALVRRQHGVVTHAQLLALGFSRHAIRHRVERGRLHPVAFGVYAVGRAEIGAHGRWTAAVLACGYVPGTECPGAVLSHGSAAALLGIGGEGQGIEVSLTNAAPRRRPEITVHRRPALRGEDVGFCQGIPVTSPAQTILDMTPRLPRTEVERMVDEADRLDLVHPPELRRALAEHPSQPGIAPLRTWLDRRVFRLTRSNLERCFMPLAARAGLPVPMTKAWVNGYEVDFHWPQLRLVVETDGLRHHRTPAQQARDHERDQAHTAAACTCLRFTHEQVRYEPERVLATLRPVARRLLAGVET